jgi:hypothetical protein
MTHGSHWGTANPTAAATLERHVGIPEKCRRLANQGRVNDENRMTIFFVRAQQTANETS